MDQTNQTIMTLVQVAASLNRSVPVPLLLFGTVGNVLNLFVLTRKSLRNMSCPFYFFSSSVANLFCLWFGLTTRFLSGYDLDPTTHNSTFCKFRYFVTYMSLSLSAFFLLFASVDRWASSSINARTRSFCQVAVAHRLVLATLVVACLLYSQAFYCYIAASDKFPVYCYCPSMICRMYNDALFLILYSIIPPILMVTFSWFTVKNVKKTRQQVNVMIILNQSQNSMMKKRDRQMVTMLLIQVISFFLCVLPSGISKAYSTLTFNREKDTLQLTKENFSFQVNDHRLSRKH